ncbi:type II secretion system protein GspM [Marinicella sediminis]|uniref:Type II secretion system protein GspM n=1 Tax=Marinicella sediminis TaxID=1792834 RepID=A0ABV7J8A8_9GAMM|nr:type II secretion system protein GspM [Marinicella sediminis]
MKNWYQQLSSSEQRLLLIGALLILAAISWRLVMVPIQNRLDAAVTMKAGLSGQLDEMQRIDLRSAQGKGVQPLPVEMTFSSWVDQQLSQQGLQETVNRTEPLDESTMTVWLVNASFDRVIDWLQRISQQHGIQVDQFDVTVTDNALGLTNIRMRINK